jgi:hypothetical protein
MTRLSTVTALAVALVAAATPPAARAALPRQFVGVNVDSRIANLANPGREFRLMARAGIGSVRVPMDWSTLQPWPNRDAVPSGERSSLRDEAGVPTDFRLTDRLIGAAASARLEVLVTVVGAPAWARMFESRAASPPRSTARFAGVVRALVRRYGPRGSFWRERRGVVRDPVRAWQVFNEPNIALFWDGGPRAGEPDRSWARQYAPFVRAAAGAIRAADPGARIVLAGLVNRSWDSLAALLAADARLARRVDAVAVHPYTAAPAGVIRILRLARAVLRAHGAGRVPIVVSEWGWPSAAGHPIPLLGIEVTPRQQAARVARTLRLLADGRAQLGVTGAYWFDWASPDDDAPASAAGYGAASFAYSGLRRLAGRGPTIAKPAFAAFVRTARALESSR